MANDVALADQLFDQYQKLKFEISKAIYGQDEVVKYVLISIFCKSHSLLVGVPGLAKTLLIQSVASALHVDFKRIQFTPDLMPSDILGAETLDKDRNFKFHQGPIFSNIILADEINRTPPKTQAALLEAMQEHAVTISGQRFSLPEPFFVLATQNPIEQEGTYPLPEAQLDRFMFMINLDYPDFKTEVDIVKNTTSNIKNEIKAVISDQDIVNYQQLIRAVPVTDAVLEYAVTLCQKTRPNSKDDTIASKFLEWGAGPRASQFLILGAKCHALLHKKYAPDIDDVRAVAKPVLRHRLVRNYKAEAEGMTVDKIISQLM